MSQTPPPELGNGQSHQPVDGAPAPVVVLAAGGGLPLELAAALRDAGRSYHLVAIEGIADAGVAAHPHTWVGLGRLGGILRALRQTGARELVILGAMTRPDLSRIGFDFGAVRHAPAILSLTRGGDDSMLRVIVRFFEGQGFIVRGVGELAPTLLAPTGPIAGTPPDETHMQAIARGRAALAALSRFDVGQAVVARPDGIVAFEAAEGTSRMLDRLAARGGAGPGAVLVKLAKHGQELRVDAPTIGAATVAQAQAAGLAGIAVGAGTTLVAERARLRSEAETAGLFVSGISTHDERAPDGGHASAIDLAKDQEPERRLRPDVELVRGLGAVAARHAAEGTTDIAVVARRGHVLTLGRNGLADGTLTRLVATLPRGWGRWLTPRRAGVLAIRLRDLPGSLAALTALVGHLRAARLGYLLVVVADTDLTADRTAATMTASDRLAVDVRASGLGYGIVFDKGDAG